MKSGDVKQGYVPLINTDITMLWVYVQQVFISGDAAPDNNTGRAKERFQASLYATKDVLRFHAAYYV